MSQAKRLGEILVGRGIISLKTRDRVLRRAESLNRRIGNVLEDLGLVTGEELAAAGDLEGATARFQQARELDPDVELAHKTMQ